MANTTRPYIGDGVRTIYPIDFALGYINRDYVFVYLDNISTFTTQLEYTWVDDSQIQLAEPVANGVPFTIRRVVPRHELVNAYEDGAILREGNLDESFKQTLMALEEIQDGYADPDGILTIDALLDMLGHRITNLGLATEDTDAVPLGQLKDFVMSEQGALDVLERAEEAVERVEDIAEDLEDDLQGMEDSIETVEETVQELQDDFTDLENIIAARECVTVDTVAEMKAQDYVIDTVVETHGYYTKGDSGAAKYLIAAAQSTDGYGNHELANGNVALLQKVNDSVSVMQFGAKANNVTNDQPAIQAAIDGTVEGRIILPEGDYRVDDEITCLKNNIHLIGLATATLVVPEGYTTTTGVVINFHDNTGQPVNCRLENINVVIPSNNGNNYAGIRWGCSYSSMSNVNVRIRGDNMKGLVLQTDDLGSGPYYNTLSQVYIQGDSNSTTPLSGTQGFFSNTAPAYPWRGPNTNTFIKCRAGGVYNAYDIKGAGNSYISCVSEAINNYHYYCNHPSVSSGAINNEITNPYCEQYPTSIVFKANENASACNIINPYYTGVATVFIDESTLQNCRILDASTLNSHGAPLVRASVKATGTTMDAGFNADSVERIGTGTYRINFTNGLNSTDYYLSCMAANTNVSPRISVYHTDYVQVVFYDNTGTATDVLGFNAIIYK